MSATTVSNSLFESAADVLIAKGVPLIPLRPASKIAFHTNWPELASTDPKQIADWGQQYPDANIASVAKAVTGGVWFFEVDKPGFHKFIEQETGEKFPETFIVRSSPGKGHFYFRQTDASIQMGNCQGKDEDGKESWSARVDNRYVVGPGSIHPKTQQPYTVLVNAPLVPAPDWLVEWCSKNDSSENERVNASPDGPSIPHGSHDNELFRIACMLRNAGMDYEQIKDNLVLICEKRCTGRGDDYVNVCENKAKSACKYPVGQASPIPVIGGVEPAAAVEIPVIGEVPYPRFPTWVMKGTSIYDGFIEPICAVNTRFPEFMFMPGITLMLNYLALKVTR